MRNFLEGGSSFPKRFKDGHIGSYNILQANKIPDLVAKIAKATKNDWKPIGGPSLSINLYDDNGFILQANKISDLVAKIAKAIKNDWQPVGGPSLPKNLCDDKGFHWIKGHHWNSPWDVYKYIQGMIHSNPGQIELEKELDKQQQEAVARQLKNEAEYEKGEVVVVIKDYKNYYNGLSYTGKLGLVHRNDLNSKNRKIPVLLNTIYNTRKMARMSRDQFEVIGSLITTPEEELLENLLTFPNNSRTLIATDISGSMGDLEEWIIKVEAITKTALPKATRVCFADKVYDNGIHTDKYLQGPTDVEALIKYYEALGFEYMIVITDGDFDTNGNISYKDNFYLILPEKWIATKHI